MDRAADISKENFRIVNVIPSVFKQPGGTTATAARWRRFSFSPVQDWDVDNRRSEGRNY